MESQKELIERLEKEKEEYRKLYEKALKEIETLKKRNSRGAGRKQRFNDRDKELIRMYRIQGQTIEELAKSFKCSAGLIHKIIKEEG